MPKTLKGKLFLIYIAVTFLVLFGVSINLILTENNYSEGLLHIFSFIPTFAIVFVIGVYFTNKYTKPLKDITYQAQNLFKNLDKEIKVEGLTEEFRSLSCSLENFRKKIISHLQVIETNSKYHQILENLLIDLQKDLSLNYRVKKIAETAALITDSDYSFLSLIDKKKTNVYMCHGYKTNSNLKKYLVSRKYKINQNKKYEKKVINNCKQYYKEKENEIIRQGIGSLAILNFDIGNELIAVLQTFSKKSDHFTKERLSLLEYISTSVDMILNNSILYRNQIYAQNFTENILQNIPIATVVIAFPELTILKSNELFKNFCQKNTVINKPILDLFPRLIKIKLLRIIEKSCKLKKPSFFKEVKFYDGSYWNISVIPTFEGNAVINFIITLQDCTDELLMRRKLQRLLSQQNQHSSELETILTNLQSGLMITDKDSNIVKWNQKLIEILGLDNETNMETWKLSNINLKKQDEQKIVYSELPTQRILKETSIKEVYLIETDKGNRKFINLSGTTLKDENNQPYGGVFTIEDITGIMLMQDKLQASLNKKREWQEKLKILNKASLQISRTTNVEKILEITGKTANELTDSNLVSVYTLSEDQKSTKDCYFNVPHDYPYKCNADVSKFNIKFYGSIYSKCMREGVPYIINDIENYSEKRELPKGHVPLRGLLVLPLTSSSQKIMGMLYVSDKKDGKKFTVEDKNIAHSLAVHASVALSNAYNYKKEKRVSDLLQKSLLPILPNFQNIEFDYAYEAATSGVMVGGDFFDIIELKDGKVGIVIADVAGKGIEAASITSTIKNTIRAFALENLSPGDILTRTNKVLYNQGMPNFVTGVVGILDISIGKLAYANAGHHPPVLYNHRLGNAIFLQHGSSPLGVLPDEIYEDFCADVNPMDTLLFYTDGLVEARINGELFGDERLVKSVLKYCHKNRPVRFIVQDVERFSNNKFHDDIAVLSMKLMSLTKERDQLNLRLGRLFNN